MCGIVGYVGAGDAAHVLLPALRKLEYRGYDSAGIATLDGRGIDTRKAVGKIAALEAAISTEPPRGSLGIAHTRWATHGRPTTDNAHPHVDCGRRIAVVHNGIIDNHRELRTRLTAQGHTFRSATDTEVIVHLLEHYLNGGGLPDAVRRAAGDLRGSFAVACISAEDPDTIVAFRRGSSPLVVGYGDGEALLASDVPALLGRTDRMLVLEDGEVAVLSRGGVALQTIEGVATHRTPVRIPWDADVAERGGYPHFMLKEIFEQPEAIRNTLRDRVDVDHAAVDVPELELTDRELAGLSRVSFLACGTSYHAAMLGRYLVEQLARVPADVEIASEFRYRDVIVDRTVLSVPVSQSGETADTLAALRHARAAGARALAICNVVGSSVAREADGVIYTRAGIEIGVAATKTFTTQMTAMILLALRLAQARGTLGADARRAIVEGLLSAPDAVVRALTQASAIEALAGQLASRSDYLFLGRGAQYPLALEGALKLKEISYLHAEGYAAGEMKHGPIALIDRGLPVVALAPATDTATAEKMACSIEEVKAREAFVVAIVTEGDERLRGLADVLVPVPALPAAIQPLATAIPLQLLAYFVAVGRGCDVDQPRNLAKSVTVE